MAEPLQAKLKMILKPLLWILLIVLLIAAASYFNIQSLVVRVLTAVADLGPWGPVVFIGFYILATILCLPGSLLTLGAGAIFGLWGAIYVSIGATIGATAAFLIGRYLARKWVKKQIDNSPKFKAIDEAVAQEGWKIVGLTRLSPVFPFSLLNYAFGITQVRLKDYFFPTWIGIIPGTVLYVYLGSLVGSLTMLGEPGRVHTPAEWAFYAVGLIATVVVTLYITRIASKALEQNLN